MKKSLAYLIVLAGVAYPLTAQNEDRTVTGQLQGASEVEELPQVEELLELVKDDELPVPVIEQPWAIKVWLQILGYKVLITYLRAKDWLAHRLTSRAT